MKYIYRNPQIQVLRLTQQDVISTSLTAEKEGLGDSINFDDFIGTVK